MNAASGLDGLEPLNHCLDAESTRRVVAFRVDPPVQARIPFLGKRANEGALDETERPEYDAFITAADSNRHPQSQGPPAVGYADDSRLGSRASVNAWQASLRSQPISRTVTSTVVEIKPEDEQIIAEILQSGAFASVEDVIHRALISLPSRELSSVPQKNLAEFLMDSPFAGAGLDLERRRQYMRPLGR